MQRNAMLMYTSCGWFFNDISGIETVQVLHYAGRVIQLAERVSGRVARAGVPRARLDAAQQQRPRARHGRADLRARSDPGRASISRRVAAHYAVLSLFDNFDDDARVYCYDVIRRDFEIHKAGRARLAVGSIEVRSIITHETASFELAALHLGETELTGGVRAATRDDYDDPARS